MAFVPKRIDEKIVFSRGQTLSIDLSYLEFLAEKLKDPMLQDAVGLYRKNWVPNYAADAPTYVEWSYQGKIFFELGASGKYDLSELKALHVKYRRSVELMVFECAWKRVTLRDSVFETPDKVEFVYPKDLGITNQGIWDVLPTDLGEENIVFVKNNQINMWS